MDRYRKVRETFESSLYRARNLTEVQDYLSKNYSVALDTSDMLRASVVLSVSSFDHLIHEIFRVEVLHRLNFKKEINNFDIPFNIQIADAEHWPHLVENFVRNKNSYKSFVDPGKFSEALSCFISDPWSHIADDTGLKAKDLKARLRTIYMWRNRIAHEADINPVLGGVSLWPIIKEDVTKAIGDLEKIGKSAIKIMHNDSTT
ncbi:hypothetical protein GCM10008171_20590 [Methylopila jiangsuensis]|uniref:RiboL-PSP-HEPN domain-containing protein n=1 Tax=Methylopila jiangsuensis TaxID=586230 RepID=A0A9W6JJ64_9HYPH|nr:HEPN domain-containing protein [Methylopila jiangsuensis]MDR6286848.1 hypothetical protein [Methylopila jiangsuensis]GLK76805.1 hypothetical protein GCM10008171_20590 [Methylopila jiangsuensis]